MKQDYRFLAWNANRTSYYILKTKKNQHEYVQEETTNNKANQYQFWIFIAKLKANNANLKVLDSVGMIKATVIGHVLYAHEYRQSNPGGFVCTGWFRSDVERRGF